MNLNLKDKVYIVTGGSEGIGEGISRTIADEGGIVVIATRAKESVTDALIQEFKAKGTDAHAIYGDLQYVENCKKAIEETVSKYGKIDGIVNNAGVNDGAGLEKGPDAFKKSIALNLYHYYYMVHYGLPWLKKSQGVIINISSKVAIVGQGGTSGYAASKGAQLGLTREWSVELYPHHIRVYAIIPADVMTPLYRQWLDSTFEDPFAKENEITAKIPLENRMTTKEEIGSTVAFLLSNKSSYTTGQFVFIDGGYVHLDRSLTIG